MGHIQQTLFCKFNLNNIKVTETVFHTDFKNVKIIGGFHLHFAQLTVLANNLFLSQTINLMNFIRGT